MINHDIQNKYKENDINKILENNITNNDYLSTPINTLYKLYTVWAEKEGNRSVSKKTFIERTLNLGYVKKSIVMDKQGIKACFEGLSIDTTSAAYTEDTLDYVLAMQSL
jgi:phage/plasmid-associated DNA primase